MALAALLALHLRASAAVPSADFIFSRAKAAWRIRDVVPFVRYGLLERYTWRNRVHDNWWHAAYRAADRNLVLHRIIVPEEEAQRLRGTTFALHLHTHFGSARADTLETNPNADAFPVLDPKVDPDASFGLLPRDPQAELIGSPSFLDATQAPSQGARPSPTPAPAASSVAGIATQAPLREIGRVEAVARDYTIAFAGVEAVHDVQAYHLVLTPLRRPDFYRLRDLWVDTSTYATLKLDVAGLFEGKPYADARWTITYVDFDGRPYVQQIKTDDTLHFGMDRYVSGLEFDFVGYDFPASIPPLEFTRAF